MLNMHRGATLVLRLAILIGLFGALMLIGAHHHDGHAREGNCALCQFASRLAAPAAMTSLGPVASFPACEAVEQPSSAGPRIVLAAPCGLRAPPLPL